MVKFVILLLLIAGLGLGVYFASFKKTPQYNNVPSKMKAVSKIRAVGDDECKIQVNEAITLLKQKAPKHFQLAVDYLGTIECVEDGSDIFDYDQPARVKFGKLTMDEGVLWLSSAIVHEACHVKQYNDFRQENLTKNVPDEVYKGKNAEGWCLEVQADVLEKMGSDKDTIDYVKNSINEEYWKVPDRIIWW